jgi:hypothetical protein
MKKTKLLLSSLLVFSLLPLQAEVEPNVALKESESIEVAQRSKKRARKRSRRSSSKKELIYALRLARAQKYLDASKALYNLSRDKRYRKERKQIKYILGLMLSELGLYQTAAYQYVGVIQQGNSRYINKALEKLSIAADYLNDSRLLNYSITKINLKRYPKDQWDMLRFRIGEVYRDKGDLSRAAKYFGKVPPDSPFYSQAKYQEGLARAELKQNKLALRNFAQLLDHREEAGITDEIRVAALLGLARTYYQAKQWDKAIDMYRKVPRDSEFWHDSLFELSWAQMRSGKFRSVLSNFHTLHSSYYKTNYLPESLLLRGIVYLYICKYQEMEKTLDLFRQVYLPVGNDIKTYLRKRPKHQKIYGDFKKFAMEYEDYSIQIKNEGYALPGMIYKHIYEQGDIRASSSYLYKLEQELSRIRAMDSEWRSSPVGKSAERLIDRRIAATEKKIGRMLRNHLIRVIDEIDVINEQEEFARFEMTNSEKEAIRNKMILSDEEKTTIDQKADRDYYVENGYEFWPFRGEYWLDELGNYHYLGVSSCK